MNVSGFDPFRAQRVYVWRNRVVRWRETPAETAFHAGIVLVSGGLLVLFLGGSAPDAKTVGFLRDWVDSSPLSWLLGTMVLTAAYQWTRLRQLHARIQTGWLAGQPVPSHCLVREEWRVGGLAIIGCLTVAIPVLGLLGRGWIDAVWLLAALLSATWLAWRWVHVVQLREAREGVSAVVGPRHLSVSGKGRLWLWQWAEAVRGFAPRRLRHGVWLLLLVPAGTAPATQAVTVLGALLLAGLVQAWQCSLNTLFSGQKWLEAQPAKATFWLGGLLVPSVLALVLAVLAALAFRAAGAMHIWGVVGGGVLATGLLQAAIVLAQRASHTRAQLKFMLAMMTLLVFLQIWPPVVPLVWVLMIMRPLWNVGRA